jgi:deoxyribodipyrimidine photolyase
MSKHRAVVVLFTRDLRLHDHPALAAAVDRGERVVPLFVLDDAVLAANWQWVAGTGTDSRPNRRLSPARLAERFDPDGLYVRRYVPELGTPAYPAPMPVAA